ncbi:MAG: hypothetical protein ABI824_07580 [Acidobacteriota bacterium]
MRPTRSKFDWLLEGVALLALLAGFTLVAYYWSRIPAHVPTRFTSGIGRFGSRSVAPGGSAPAFSLQQLWSARNGLWFVMGMNALAYIGLTLANRYQKLVSIPEQLARQSPHLRPLVYSMVIAAKTVLMLFSLFLVWSLISVGTGRGAPVNRESLTLFTLAVPLPLILFTWISHAARLRSGR